MYVHPDYHRRGVARKLYSALLDVLRAQNIHQALAGIVIPNDPSVGFHSSMGFVEIARYNEIGYKFDQWWATIWMQKMLSDSDSPPKEPIPFSQLSQEVIDEILRKYGG